ncbi:MAG: helix-turn-helix domain-containing protein [Eubacterium sp.]
MLGERIKELRDAHGINQVKLGEALFVKKQTVSNWENNNILPSIDMLIKIADYFSVSTDYLLCRDDRQCLIVDGLTTKQIAHINQIVKDIKGNSAKDEY